MTATITDASIEAAIEPAESSTEKTEPTIVPDHVRLRELFTSVLPPQLDHSGCEHPANDSARRACRRRKLREVMGSEDETATAGNKLYITGPDGERYVSETLVRAEVLLTARRQGWCQDGQNKTLKRLRMPLITYGRVLTDVYDFDVTVTRQSPARGNRAFTRDAVETAITRIAREMGSPWSARLISYGEVIEKTVVMEGDQIVSSQDRTVRRANLIVTSEGGMAIPDRWSEEEKHTQIKRHINSWAQYQMSGEVSRINSITKRPSTPQKVNDEELLKTYAELVGVALD